MSLTSKRELLARIHGRYQRAGRPHKSRILSEFCATCGYHDRLEHPELVALMNEWYAQEWSWFTNHFKPTFKLLKREKQAGKTRRIYEPTPKTP